MRSPDNRPYAHPEMLVAPRWLDAHRDEFDQIVLDLRPAAAYAAGHIPHARRIDDALLRNPGERETYLPRPDVFARQMGEAGVGNRAHLILYDAEGGRHAARLWYVLNAFGHRRVSLLNGGWLAWTALGLPTTRDIPETTRQDFRVQAVPELTCPLPQVLARKPGTVVLDTRSPGEFSGATPAPGAKREGHIPGAVNVEWKENVAGPNLEFKSAADLRALYAAKGITPDKEIVAYCASGGRAAQTLFTLKLLGYPKVRVYYGSFSDYAGLPGAPVER